MRTFLSGLSLLLAGGCVDPSESVPRDPPPRLAVQTSDLPPAAFLKADLVVTIRGEHRPYCFGVDELLSWLKEQAVATQQWTQLENGRWRLDGFAYRGEEHTVWVFEQSADGVELVGYKDSAIAERTHKSIMEIYYPYVSSKHSDPVRQRYGTCKNPYD
ncbi:MAG TPA: hypothetical protein VE046_11415 [Steroidobacteraceae bacterium]|nr:hypothetical protein [Steroidobacteraceae bacterium]